MFLYNETNSWVKINGVILSFEELCKEVPDLYSTVKYYYPKATYKYNYENQEYQSNSIGNNMKNIQVCKTDSYGVETKPEKKFWSTWKENGNIEVYVNPKRPNESVIVNSMSKYFKLHNLALIISGILLLLVLYAIK